MIKLTQNTPTFGDSTAGYNVELTKEYTVKEFIDEVLTFKEWGYIGIGNNNSIFGNPHIEYRKDELLSNFEDNILDKKIDRVKASGGWTRMDYLLYLK